MEGRKGVARKFSIAESAHSCCDWLCPQQEAKAERKEEQLHARAVNAALHGNIGRAMHLEVRLECVMQVCVYLAGLARYVHSTKPK